MGLGDLLEDLEGDLAVRRVPLWKAEPAAIAFLLFLGFVVSLGVGRTVGRPASVWWGFGCVWMLVLCVDSVRAGFLWCAGFC